MKDRRAAFRQIDVTRALRAARAAGLIVSGYVVEADGKIVVQTGGGNAPESAGPLDRWMKEHAERSA